MTTSEIYKRVASGAKKIFIYNVKFVCGISKTPGDEKNKAILGNGIYSTEINILNYGPKSARIVKLFTPVVMRNVAIAREPKTKKPVSFEFVDLKPLHATMDDCTKIDEKLKSEKPDEQLKIGYVEIISPVSIEVYAVYTANNLLNDNPSINVVQVQEKVISFT